MRIALITKDLSSNSIGRTYVLWLLARYLGWSVRVVAPLGEKVWQPVATADFVKACELIERNDLAQWDTVAQESDLLVAIKPHEDSFGIGYKLAKRNRKPILLDIDDPDLEAQRDTPLKSAARMIMQPRRFWRRRILTSHVPKVAHLVSNPQLQSIYGGTLVPHAREDTGNGKTHDTRSLSVVFVGTNRQHKGLDILRAAISELSAEGAHLTITDMAPSDARPHESWVGTTSLATGIELVKNGDVVVIPSLPGHAYSQAQLPVKIMDAMLAARPVVVSDIGPLRWAIGSGGLVVTPGSVTSLVAALRRLLEPSLRENLGNAGRQRGLTTFTVEAITPAFEQACKATVRDARQAFRR